MSHDIELRRWLAGGGAPSALHLNEPVDWINGFMQARAMAGHHRRDDGIPRPFLAVIVDKGPLQPGTAPGVGPKPAPDLKGSMYWVKISVPRYASEASKEKPSSFLEDKTNAQEVDKRDEKERANPPPNIFAALNLAEYLANSHTLQKGTPVQVWAFYDAGQSSGDSVPVQRLFFSTPPMGTLFAVNVTKDGGDDGGKTSAASWTYTVKNLDNADPPLGTKVGVTKTRPNGKMAFGGALGLAFYEGSTLRLWDAGEIPGTGGC